MLANHYRQLAEKPISDADFYGDDVRYSTEFECLENELNKANSLHDKQGPDWMLVRDGCEALLQSQSKDLRAAVWLTWSLYQVDSVTGLEAGLGALNYLCSQHWPALHPHKPRTRLAAFSWLIPRIDQAISELQPGAAQPKALERLGKQLRELDQCLASHFADQAPLLMPTCRRLETLTKAPEPPIQSENDSLDPASTSANSAQIIPINNANSDMPNAVNDSRDAHKCLRSIQDQARLLSNWWLQEMTTDPRAFRLARTLLWLPIDALPEHDAQNCTTLRGLPADRLTSYRERLAQAQFSGLLVDLEASLARSPFWLDGQFIAWQCLQALDAQAAMYEVEIQLAMLLKRLPGLEELCFHDQTPFADDETRHWISAHIVSHTSSNDRRAEGQANSGTEGAQPPWEEALAAATQQLRKGSLKAGIQLIKQAMPNLAGERERFNWQLAQARLCFQARQYDLARHQLESLYQVLQGSDLERWEPDLALSVLQLLLECCDKLPSSPALRERKNEIYQRLCHLDLEAALDQASGP
ncbi:type VI secretion system protein TssA [Pseudomonas sp. NyZ704]|nr:type VI secretion system protein TssA [Pseudomonas sp. NyZ704]